MKKVIPVILILMLVFSLTACSDDVKETEKTEGTSNTEESNANTAGEETVVPPESEEPDANKDGDETAGYDAYTEDLIQTGYVSSVSDKGNGNWIITVTNKWKDMDESEKLDFANDIFSELSVKADEQYGKQATVKMINKSGNKVAASSKDGDGMKIYQ